MIRVFLVDDQQLVRAGFRMLIESQDDMEVVGEAGDGAEATEQLSVTAADIVLMDVRMPRMDGVEATRVLAERGEHPRVVVLTTFDLDEYVYNALRAGASAFLLKDALPEMLLGAIRDVHAGDAVVAPSVTRRMLERFLSEPPRETGADDRLARLTDRENEVLQLIAQGRPTLRSPPGCSSPRPPSRPMSDASLPRPAPATGSSLSYSAMRPASSVRDRPETSYDRGMTGTGEVNPLG